jgi:HD superfamily phosphohydrolase
MFDFRHTFRDPVHGFIAVTTEERELIDHHVVQRLRRIRQLGTSSLLYHGAEHSRFGHALGVLELATRVLEAVRRKRPDLFESDRDYGRLLQLARLAGLLHDVGHSPFSHASEDLFPQKNAAGKYTHEDYTAALIVDSPLATAIRRNFRRWSIKPQDIVDVFVDPAAHGTVGILLQDLLAGELDADRMDYLSRDSLYAGVAYGRFDRDRLLDSITAVEDDDGVLHLAVEMGGLQALEGFLLARYFMFQQVYLARVRRFYDLALVRFLETVLPGGVYPTPAKLRQYLAWDDIHVLELSRRKAPRNIWAAALWRRQHWQVVSEEPGSASIGVRWGMAAAAVQSRFRPDEVCLDTARGKTQRNAPRPYITGGMEEEERPKILVLDRDGRSWEVERQSDLVATISAKNIIINRVFARPDKFAEVSAAFEASFRS